MKQAIGTVVAALVLAVGLLVWGNAQTSINGGRTGLGVFDFSGATETKPVKTGSGAAPGACNSGDLYLRTGQASPASQLFFCDPANTQTAIGAPAGCPTGTTNPGLCLLEEHTLSSSANLSFTTCITASYDDYQIELNGLVPATNTQELDLNVSTNGGASYDTSANYYTGILYAPNTGATGALQTSTATTIQVFTAISSTASRGGVSGTIKLFSPGSTSLGKAFTIGPILAAQGAAIYSAEGMGFWNQTTAVNAIQFKFASGNIASGVGRCYGLTQ